MSSTSPFFNLVLATTSDTVNVVTQIANNFSALDTLISQVHTGTGELKANLTLTSPTLIGADVSGTLSAASITATAGVFQTITATGGSFTATSFAIGTYSYPSTIGSTGQVLTVTTGNAVWITPIVYATVSLNNLASVSINTSLNNFTAGTVVLSSLTATAGSLTGLSTLAATGVSVAGTMTAQTITATGGSLTINSLNVGTYAVPGTIGSSGQVLGVSGAAVAWTTLSIAVNDIIASFPRVGPDAGEYTTNGGIIVGTGFSTTASAGNILYAWAATTNGYANILKEEWIKPAGINSLAAYGIMNVPAGSNAWPQYRVRVTDGTNTASGAYTTSGAGAEAPGTYAAGFTLDVSTLGSTQCSIFLDIGQSGTVQKNMYLSSFKLYATS